MKKTIIAAALAGASFVTASPAVAATYSFNITGPQAISFSLPSAPTPSLVEAGKFFRIDGQSGLVNGAAATFNLGFGSSTYRVNFGFFNSSAGSNFLTTGVQLYTGSEAMPTFTLGSFALSDGYSLTIADAAAAVPEPATWAMLLAGFGLMGFAMRRRSKNVTTTVAYAA